MIQAKMTFPPDFLWGTATSSHQVEGNNTNNDWWQFEQGAGNILEGGKSGLACDWWQHAENDLDLAAEMGNNAHRISLEWSRIEPQPSLFDNEALDRYREILECMIDRGIEPMVCLHHFSNPLWLVEKGDFNSDLIVDYFGRYTAKVVSKLGDLVSKWLTINEPSVYVFLRYIDATYPPPSEKGFTGARKAMINLLRCHAAAYHTIKERYPEAQVSVAKQLRIFEARPDGNKLDSWWAKQLTNIFNHSWLKSMATGRLQQPFGRGTIKGLAGSFDFIGINYYTRNTVRFPPRNGFFDEEWAADALVSDGNYGEVYPYGLYRVIRQALPYNKPLYITENGLPDREDKLRPAFLLDHLRQIWQALSFCYPVMGYYHWSLVDNFEWDAGWTQRFGLIEMNEETQERTWRPSGRLYSEICHSYSIGSDMTARYAPQLLDVMFPGQAPEDKQIQEMA
ncbi:MAG: glycoside hydrolase family 1 protein [Candidatus Promineifilaceae bacterium]